MMNIYTHAQQVKTNTKEMIEYIENRYEAATNDDERDALAMLYKKFAPPAPKKPRTVFEWLHLATTKENKRFYLCEIWCDGKGTAVATDSHFMHIAPCDKPEGYYDHAGHRIEIDATFPQWERVANQDMSSAVTVTLSEIREKDGEIHVQKMEGLDDTFGCAILDKIRAFGEPEEWRFDPDSRVLVASFADGRRAVTMARNP